MTIKASLQAIGEPKFGFVGIKVGGKWYGCDQKNFSPPAAIGDIVEFEEFSNAKGYATYKSQGFKKVATAAASGSSDTNAGNGSVSSGRVVNETAGNRQDYWTAKGSEDAKRDPRISYFASLERAIQFVDLALRNGAIGAYEKAKATGKLEVLTALVYETTQRIMAEAYTQAVPVLVDAKAKSVITDKTIDEVQPELESDPEESWA